MLTFIIVVIIITLKVIHKQKYALLYYMYYLFLYSNQLQIKYSFFVKC